MSTAQLRESLKQRACETIDRLKNDLEAISHDIHAHPEENFEEHHAHKLLTEAIADNGHKVTRKAYGLDTAFESTIGTQGATVAVLCEYDALPGIGHACGHNIIAAAGLGAGLALAGLAEEAGGRLKLMGTPAEEGGGGAREMIKDGRFCYGVELVTTRGVPEPGERPKLVELGEALAAVAASKGHDNKVYELGADTPFTLHQMAAALSKAVGKTIPYNDLPQEAYAGILASVGVPEGFAAMIADAEAGVPQGWLSAESGTLSRLIGRPTTSLEDAVTAALKG